MEKSDAEVAQHRISASSHILKDADKADLGLEAGEEIRARGLTLDDATNKRLRRKADLIIMPACLICFVYAVQFLDRTAISYASIMGMIRDLQLTGGEYSWMGSIYFFGFLAAEFPTGRMLQRFPIGKYLSTCAIIWGVVLCCFTVVKDYQAALGLRFLLGALQACVSPALLLIVSQWYTRPEQVTRMGLWISSNGIAQCFGGFVAYGLAVHSMHNQWTLASWKVTFLLFGLMAVVVGCMAMLFLPDSQLNAWWLSRDDRLLAVERVRSNQSGIGNTKFKISQIREVVQDPFTWMMFIFAITANIPAGGLTNFFSQLIVSFGYTPVQAQLYSTPGGAFSVIAILTWAFVAQKWNCRLLAGVGLLAVAMLGAILLIAIPARYPAGRLVGFYLTMALPTGDAAVAAIISANAAGYTKKTTLAALLFVGYCIGNIIGPQTFQARNAPHYVPAEITIIVLLAFSIIDMLAMYFYFRYQNRRKAALRAASDYVRPHHNNEFLDMTDKENPEFVYSY